MFFFFFFESLPNSFASQVSELIDSCLKTGRPLIDMCAWLLCNSLASEVSFSFSSFLFTFLNFFQELQYMQLCQQEISHFWRKRAVEEMKVRICFLSFFFFLCFS